MEKNFWNRKTVVVTGSQGFVGSRLVDYLASQGAHVIGVTNAPSKTYHSFSGGVVDRKKLEKIFKAYTPFACFHLAARSTVEEGTHSPHAVFHDNITGALNILELSRVYGTKRVIIASTSHVYGEGSEAFDEKDPPRPSRPYETSKTCVDLIAQSYADTFHLPVLIPRFANIYGPGDRHMSRIIPKTIDAILTGHAPTMWGGRATREYLYIDDAIHAYDLLGRLTNDKVEKNRIYNFGSKDLISVRELIEKIIKLSGASLPIEKIPEERPDEIQAQSISWVKAKRILGWEPKIRLNEGLEKTIAWFRSI